jgi:hypothetical protein
MVVESFWNLQDSERWNAAGERLRVDVRQPVAVQDPVDTS